MASPLCAGLRLVCNLALTLAAATIHLGCSGSGVELGYVEGSVTLDGSPLPEALVYFRHEDGGRNAQAQTDEDGRFVLNFSSSEAGAIVGANTVRITTFVEPNFDDSGKLIAGTGKKELVPERYNKQSELVVNIVHGSNDLTFDLLTGE